MKDIEKALTTDYPEAAKGLVFENKTRITELYTEARPHRAPKRAAAFALAAAALITAGTTAAAFTSPDFRSALRELVGIQTRNTGISEQKADELTDMYEYLHVSTDDIARSPINIEVNKYGETLGGTRFETDLIGVVNDYGTSGYIYRYDLGMLETSMLLTEENIAAHQSGLYDKLTAPDPETGIKRNWVYAFDEDGIEIVGKYIPSSTGFRSNKQLEDPQIRSAFSSNLPYPAYEEFVQDRIDYKLEHGEAPPIDKVEKLGYNPYGLATENMDLEYTFVIPELLSKEATVECNDPEFAEITDFYCAGQKTDYPCGIIYCTCHKLGSAVFTIKDGKKEYKYECSLTISNKGYYTSSEVKLD